MHAHCPNYLQISSRLEILFLYPNDVIQTTLSYPIFTLDCCNHSLDFGIFTMNSKKKTKAAIATITCKPWPDYIIHLLIHYTSSHPFFVQILLVLGLFCCPLIKYPSLSFIN